jgi:predicted TIM-barrel fold metal-dependent hydrolase
MTIKIIDPHLHLFNRSRGDYHWLKTQNPPFWSDKSIIQQDFSIDDINNSLLVNNKIKLSSFIHIEAGFDNTQPWRELEYIESFDCQNNRTIASIDLLATPEHFQATLQRLQQYQSLIGARHIFDEQAYTILTSHHAQQNFASLNEVANFIFELQLPLADEGAINVMPLLTETISNNSQLRFIINHAGFPPKASSKNISCDAWNLWQQHITELAKYPNVIVKCSGWEMQDRLYKMSWFSKVTSFCINTFSIERVMLASNFPLCLLGKKLGRRGGQNLGRKLGSKLDSNPDNELSNKDYESYWQDILESDVIKQCTESEKNALLYHNALRIYRLPIPER